MVQQRRQVTGATQTGRRTAELLRLLISHQRVGPTNQAEALLECVRTVAPQLLSASPSGAPTGHRSQCTVHIAECTVYIAECTVHSALF